MALVSVLVSAAHVSVLVSVSEVMARDGGLEDRPRSQGWPRDLILMASVLVSVSAVSVLVSEVLVSTTTLLCTYTTGID